MQDLRSQLIARLGATPPAAESSVPETVDPLGPTAHLDSAWMVMLRDVLPVGGVAQLPSDAKLARCQQATAQTVKALKKAGRGRDARALTRSRDDYLARRARLAWSRVKTRFQEAGASDKAYRALKQGNADPERVLRNLEKLSREQLDGMGARRLREVLEG